MSGLPAASPTDRDGGFTLVEVLVAFAIVAAAAVTVLQIGSETVLRASRIEALELPFEEAEGIVLERAASGSLKAGTERGAFSDGRAWTLSAADIGPSLGWTDGPPLWRVRLTEGGPEGRLVYLTILSGALRDL